MMPPPDFLCSSKSYWKSITTNVLFQNEPRVPYFSKMFESQKTIETKSKVFFAKESQLAFEGLHFGCFVPFEHGIIILLRVQTPFLYHKEALFQKERVKMTSNFQMNKRKPIGLRATSTQGKGRVSRKKASLLLCQCCPETSLPIRLLPTLLLKKTR